MGYVQAEFSKDCGSRRADYADCRCSGQEFQLNVVHDDETVQVLDKAVNLGERGLENKPILLPEGV